MKLFDNPSATVKSRYGQYRIAVTGNIVAVCAGGMAGESAIASYSRDMEATTALLDGQRWAFLGLLHGSAVLTGDGEVALQKSVEWRAARGMAVGALVVGDTTVAALVTSQFARIYENAGVPLGVFSDEDSALDWLASQGFHTALS
ncbi:hypothetical protein OCL06_15360 [Alteromonas sp. ASW11-19]|uniref:STAS/SEC14 domain-containing protein n=1 Tax=Alteromonas salexigens TaxID=2982530 RepID=A0ABT2VRL6_9ALTE|nr:hypothetical protein [Alteromonas salexigens]MCU7555967.1 hypothetical protein [Alteromonas salexigens]